ncbi:hypothetical protein QUB16_17510 [Microcoleus sp. D3_18a_C4]
MPVPQENSLFVEQASCLSIKSLLRRVQHLSLNWTYASGLRNRVFYESGVRLNEPRGTQKRRKRKNKILFFLRALRVFAVRSNNKKTP